MRAKKHNFNKVSVSESAKDSFDSDHEQFLRSFEKPTQIYRYLRFRHIALPIFLPRTLRYLKGRKSVLNRKRGRFEVDSILATAASRNASNQQHCYKQETLTVRFDGFFNHAVRTDAELADVEMHIVRNGHRKRKCPCLESNGASPRISLGSTQIPINPSPNSSPLVSTPTITHKFSHSNSCFAQSCDLLLTITCPMRHRLPNGIYNGFRPNPESPPAKRRKIGRCAFHEEEPKKFAASLKVYDCNHQCLLSNGKYQVVLSDCKPVGSPSSKPMSWITLQEAKSLKPYEVFQKLANVKFSLHWSEKNSCSAARQPACLSGSRDAIVKEAGRASPMKRRSLRYVFRYGNDDAIQQQTDVRDDLRCPWCSLLSPHLFGLLKHLRLCHSRFNFLFSPQSNGDQIEVTVNTMYDGSYVGNPQDIHSHIGLAFSRLGPIRRSPVTHVIVYRPRQSPMSLDEFLEPERHTEVNRQIVQGHNRLYFRSLTCQPMTPQEIDIDSDDDTTPPWMYQKTALMIDEFTDVNNGEKEFMKMWNMHVMKHGSIADCQLSKACFAFVKEHGKDVLVKNLSKNFLIHLVNLFDFSLIRPDVVQRAYAMLENLRYSISPAP